MAMAMSVEPRFTANRRASCEFTFAWLFDYVARPASANDFEALVTSTNVYDLEIALDDRFQIYEMALDQVRGNGVDGKVPNGHLWQIAEAT